jgi:uncharacterized lipoprotein YehR (DUF1307 family)
MKKLISLFTALFLLVSLSSCNKDDESTPGQSITFSAEINGIKRGSSKQLYCYGYRNTNLTILQKYLQLQ